MQTQLAVQYVLTPECREQLLKLFPPRYSRAVCQHVTMGRGEGRAMYELFTELTVTAPVGGRVIGHVADNGVETLLITFYGSAQRKDGRLFHITLSLEPPHRAVESNQWTIDDFQPVPAPVPYLQGLITLVPASSEPNPPIPQRRQSQQAPRVRGGARYIFNYRGGAEYPEYCMRAGQQVTVIGPEDDGMYAVRADDGWRGLAHDEELTTVFGDAQG